RAALRRALAAGDVDVGELVAGDGDEAHERTALRMTVTELLEASPATCERTVALAGAARLDTLNVRLGELTTARRRTLAAAIRLEARR
ncbi:MAG TPA: hypothetical protein VLE97_04335, partial [Gaiellaceae bacterium]|nr:hypothetical protein [Gaiellaceae bacterium]